jgi:hypothetical protein
MGISSCTPADQLSRSFREKSARAVIEVTAEGKWILIRDSGALETFESFHDAATRAVEEFGVGSYLIRTGAASVFTLPSSVVFQSA